jgi:hypothetical protein
MAGTLRGGYRAENPADLLGHDVGFPALVDRRLAAAETRVSTKGRLRDALGSIESPRRRRGILGRGHHGHQLVHLLQLNGNLKREMTRVDHGDRDVVAANGVGFMSQAYEATAGPIGNTLVALGRHPEARAASGADRGQLKAVVQEVVRASVRRTGRRCRRTDREGK